MTDKIIVVENDIGMRGKISDAFEIPGSHSFKLDFHSTTEAVGLHYGYHDYSLAIVDIHPDYQAAAIVARLISSSKPAIGIIILAPSAEYLAPVELIEMELGPVIISDDDGINSLKELSAILVEEFNSKTTKKITEDDLRKRNKELRNITDTLARQSVHLLRLRNELFSEKLKLETVINGMGDGMAFFGVDGELSVINPVATKLFSSTTTNEKMVFDQFINNLNTGLVIDKEAKGEVYKPFEAEFGDKVILVRAALVYDAEGDEAGHLVLLTDITKEKEYERMKDDFSSMISHELRTPLTSIRAAADNLIRGNLGKVSEDQCKFLELIVRNVDRQQGLIDNLLDLAKLETGQLHLQVETVQLASLALLAVEEFSLAFKDKNISMETSFDENMPEIKADPHLITQVLNNLLSNALKFTDEGGKVTVSLGTENLNGVSYASLTVIDTGIGVEPDHFERIFDRYTQADSSTRRRYGGTGLGLSICKEIVKTHNGSISVESRLGEGSAFKVLLPVTGNSR